MGELVAQPVRSSAIAATRKALIAMIFRNRTVSPPHIWPSARYWNFEFEQQLGFLEAASLKFIELSVTWLDRSHEPLSLVHRRKQETGH